MPKQIKRLALVFAIFICIFLLIRYLLTPATFGEFGHYRGASLAENASIEIHYAGQTACIECHQDIEDMKAQDAHSKIHCETCHGPGQKHVLSGNAADIVKPSEREFCGRCHGINAARQKSTITQIDLKKHNVEKKCIECHNSHQPRKIKDEIIEKKIH
jgi:hypothetical protein